MFKRFIVLAVLVVMHQTVVAQLSAFVVTTPTHTVAPGATVELTYIYSTSEEDVNKVTYYYGVQHSRQFKQAVLLRQTREMESKNGQTTNKILQVITFTAPAAGNYVIPAGYATTKGGDTVWSDTLLLHVVAGFKQDLFPPLTEKELFSDPGDISRLMEEYGFNTDIKMGEATHKAHQPFFVNAGPLYHRQKTGTERTEATRNMNQMVSEIVQLMNGRPGSEPLGLYVNCNEPRCLFAVADTTGLRGELEKIYDRYSPTICTTQIATPAGDLSIFKFSSIRNTWQEVDRFEEALNNINDNITQKRKVYVRINFQKDSAMEVYNKWAASEGYTIEKTEKRQPFPTLGATTDVVYTIISDARPQTLYDISALHRQKSTEINNCRYSNLGIDKAGK